MKVTIIDSKVQDQKISFFEEKNFPNSLRLILILHSEKVSECL